MEDEEVNNNNKNNQNQNNDINLNMNNIEETNNQQNISNFFTIRNKIIIIIIYFIIIISTEFAYRNPLFDKSVEIESDIQNSIKNSSNEKLFKNFWKFISVLGTAAIILSLFFIIFITHPLNYSFLFLHSIIYSSFLTNFLKIIYSNSRPYWMNPEKIYIACNGGYGNPSGHSDTSVCLYLSLAHILTDFKFFKTKKGFIYKIILYAFFIIIILLIMISRILLGAHSINQVIYGGTLGLGLYYFLFFIIKYHTYTNKQFFEMIIKKSTLLFYTIIHFSLIIIDIIIYEFRKDNKLADYVRKNIFNGKRCKIKDEYHLFKHDGFFQSLCLFAIIGAYLGLFSVFHFIQKNKKYNKLYVVVWNQTVWNKILLRIPLCLISCIGIIFYYIIPGDLDLEILFIFKASLPFLLAGFGIYFLGVLFCVLANCVNQNIYNNNYYNYNIENNNNNSSGESINKNSNINNNNFNNNNNNEENNIDKKIDNNN